VVLSLAYLTCLGIKDVVVVASFKYFLYCKLCIQVMDRRSKNCLTLVLDNRVQEGKFCCNIQNTPNKRSDEMDSVHTWELEWFSEETLVKFISVLTALYSAASPSSLPVKCI
jgi:hypothetical protein